MPLEDAQFLETRKFSRSEIASIFRVPPHLIGDLDKATFSNIEHQSLDFSIHTVRPWTVRMEQAYLLQLFKPVERKRFFAEHVIDGLLRGDFQSRMTGYSIGRQNGFMSPNDVCEIENWNPIAPEDGGDTYLIPSNMLPAERALNPPEPAPVPSPVPEEAEEKPNTPISDYQPWMSDAAGRIVRRECLAIGRQAKRFMGVYSMQEFSAWLDDFYTTMPEHVNIQLMPVIDAYREMWDVNGEADDAIKRYLAGFSARHVAESKKQLLSAIVDAEPRVRFAVIENLLSEWNETRPAKIGKTQSTAIKTIMRYCHEKK
jgi:hypothetical protein